MVTAALTWHRRIHSFYGIVDVNSSFDLTIQAWKNESANKREYLLYNLFYNGKLLSSCYAASSRYYFINCRKNVPETMPIESIIGDTTAASTMLHFCPSDCAAATCFSLR